MDEEWLAPSEAARILGVSIRTLHNMADSGKLVAQRTPIGRLISSESVHELKELRDADSLPG